MQDLWTQFISLPPEQQAVIVGVAVSAALAVAKRLWPSFAASPELAKFGTAVTLAGLVGYAAGGWQGAVLAVLVALGTYDGGKNLLRNVLAPVWRGFLALPDVPGDPPAAA